MLGTVRKFREELSLPKHLAVRRVQPSKEAQRDKMIYQGQTVVRNRSEEWKQVAINLSQFLLHTWAQHPEQHLEHAGDTCIHKGVVSDERSTKNNYATKRNNNPIRTKTHSGRGLFYIAPVLQQKPLANRLNAHCTVFAQAMGKTGRILRTTTEMKKKNKVSIKG